MKVFFIPAKSKTNINEAVKNLDFGRLNGRIGLVTTVQYLDQVKNLDLPRSKFVGQIIGCNSSQPEKYASEIDCFLYIGSGDFHPLEVLLKIGKPTFIFNPETNQFSQLDPKILEDSEKRLKGKLSKFYHSENIGILVTKKPLQKDLLNALKLKEKKDKKYYIFFFDNLNEMDLENFPQIDFWVNTACPRIESKKVINIAEVMK
ncbi:diphthamide synthesis protein [Candidatus Woesearchaeota archaeon]|nr:diphthamide synthesis protein [Candidatus Woesearchaeota archaeon]